MWLCGKNGCNAPCQQADNALSQFLSCIRAKQDRFSQISMRDGKVTEKWEGGKRREHVDRQRTTHASYRHYSLWRPRSAQACGSTCTNLRSRAGHHQRPGSWRWDVGCESAARECEVRRTTV